MNTFSNTELAPILEAYNRMLNEGYLTDKVNENPTPELEAAIVKVLEKHGFEVQKSNDGYRLLLDGRLFSICSTLGDIFGVFGTFVNIGQKYYYFLRSGKDVNDTSVWNGYLNRNAMMRLSYGEDGRLNLYGSEGNLLRSFDGFDGFMAFVRKCQQISQKLISESKKNIEAYGSDRSEYMERQKEWTIRHGCKSKEWNNRYQREVYRKNREQILEKQRRNRLDRINGIENPIERFIRLVNTVNFDMLKRHPEDTETRKLNHTIASRISARCKYNGLPDTTLRAMAAMCRNMMLRGLSPDAVYNAFSSNGFSLKHAISAFTGRSVDEIEREFEDGTFQWKPEIGESFIGTISESSKRHFENLDDRKTFRGNMSMFFKKVEKKDVPRLLDEIDGYVENERYRREQFEKYLGSTKGIDSPSKSMYYGLFDSEDGKCLALSYLNRVPDDFVLIAEIQSIFKGCGKILIENISSLCDNMWLAADPTAKSTLVEYYRQFGFDEKTYRETKWSEGKKETFFFKTSDDKHKKELIGFLEKENVKTISFPSSEWTELGKRITDGKKIITHRVSDDVDKYEVGDIVSANLGLPNGRVYMRVAGKKLHGSVNDSPYFGKLTERQKSFLSRFRKIAVLTLVPVENG